MFSSYRQFGEMRLDNIFFLARAQGDPSAAGAVRAHARSRAGARARPGLGDDDGRASDGEPVTPASLRARGRRDGSIRARHRMRRACSACCPTAWRSGRAKSACARPSARQPPTSSRSCCDWGWRSPRPASPAGSPPRRLLVQSLSKILYGVGPFDPVTFAIVPLFLVLAATVACVPRPAAPPASIRFERCAASSRRSAVGGRRSADPRTAALRARAGHSPTRRPADRRLADPPACPAGAPAVLCRICLTRKRASTIELPVRAAWRLRHGLRGRGLPLPPIRDARGGRHRRHLGVRRWPPHHTRRGRQGLPAYARRLADAVRGRDDHGQAQPAQRHDRAGDSARPRRTAEGGASADRARHRLRQREEESRRTTRISRS